MTSFIRHIVESFLAADTTRRKVDVIRRVPGMSAQNFNSYMKDGRNVSSKKWPVIRKALGMSKDNFWAEARDFYDKD